MMKMMQPIGDEHWVEDEHRIILKMSRESLDNKKVTMAMMVMMMMAMQMKMNENDDDIK